MHIELLDSASKKKINIFDIVIFLLLFGVYALNRTSSVVNKEYSWLAIVGITIIMSIFQIIRNKKIHFGVYVIFQICFLGITFVSRYWAVSPELAKGGFNSLLLTSILLFSIVNIIESEQQCQSFLRALAWAGIAMFFYFGFKNGFLNIINIRNSSQNEIITDVNANDLGMKYVISALSAKTYTYYDVRKKNIYNGLTIVLSIFSLFTGSRKVLIMLGFCFSVMYILEKKNRKMLRIIISTIVLIVFFYLIMTIPTLYKAIGIRLEETFTIFSDNVNPYTSTGIRLSMANLGEELFKNKPILGYGLANAEIYNGGTYLHNNYLELLVGVGLLGTVTYYINPILSVLRNKKLYKINQDKIALFFFMIIVCLLILDFTFVSYNSRAFQILIAVASKHYTIKKSNEIST